MVSDVIGLLSGLLAVFTFLTGTTSARELFRRAGERRAGRPSPRRRPWLVLGVSAPVFVLSMVVTLNAGLEGSDTGGAQFLLLLIGAVLLVAWALRWSGSMRWTAFLATCLAVLSGLGVLLGTISVGEEAEGLSAGLTIGVGVGLLALAFRPLTGKPTVAADPAPVARMAPAARDAADGTAAADVTPVAVTAAVGGAEAAAPDPSRPERVDQEREILALVQEQGGEVTAFDVGLRTSLSLHQAREILDQLTAGGFCQRQVTPDGATRYRFPDVRVRP